MPAPKIRSIEFIGRFSDIKPEQDNCDLQVKLEDGSHSSFVVSTPNEPGRWLDDNRWEFCHGTPVLYVRRLDKETVKEAVEAMAAEMGGYWLRYYNSLGDVAGTVRELRIRHRPRGKEAA